MIFSKLKDPSKTMACSRVPNDTLAKFKVAQSQAKKKGYDLTLSNVIVSAISKATDEWNQFNKKK